MATHRKHPDPANHPEDSIPGLVLFVDCPRCAEHATHPVHSLDPQKLKVLWHHMLTVENGREYDHYRNPVEAKACYILYDYYLAFSHLKREGILPYKRT
jgi:hypothetical protein